ncbi:hypothetical protein D3C72_1475390 [compost metagenome]
MAGSGMASTTTSTPSTAPCTSAGTAPMSSATLCTPLTPPELATFTSWPADSSLRARVAPIFPVPIIPIFMFMSSVSLIVQCAVILGALCNNGKYPPKSK